MDEDSGQHSGDFGDRVARPRKREKSIVQAASSLVSPFVSIEETALIGLGATKARELIRRGEVRSIRAGRRRLIYVADLARLFDCDVTLLQDALVRAREAAIRMGTEP